MNIERDKLVTSPPVMGSITFSPRTWEQYPDLLSIARLESDYYKQRCAALDQRVIGLQCALEAARVLILELKRGRS